MTNIRPHQLGMLTNVDHWTFTNIDHDECRHMWVVKNPGDFVGDLISTIFAAQHNEHNVKWQLVLSWADMKLYLKLKAVSAANKEALCKYNVSILENNGKFKSVYSSALSTLGMISNTYFPLPFTPSQNQNLPKEWLIDNMLTIVVHITMPNSIQQKTGMITRETAQCTANEDFGKLLNDPEFSDVTVIVGDTKFPVHKNILAFRSDVFAAMLRHDLEEKKTNQIVIDDFDSTVVWEMLRYIYTGQSSEITQMAGELLAAADKYAVEGLKKACIRELTSNLTIETVINALISADLHSLDDLKQQAIDFINTHFLVILKTDAFRELMKNYPDIVLVILKRQKAA